MAATFDDVINRLQLDNQQTIDQLEINNQTNVRLLSKVDTSIMMLSDRLGDFIEQFRLQQLDMLELLREGGGGGSPFPGSSPTGSGSGGASGGGGFGFGILPLGLAGAASAVAGGGLALGGALAGLRGWEKDAIKSLQSFIRIPLSLSEAVTSWFKTSSLGQRLVKLGASISDSGVVKFGGAIGKLAGKFLLPIGVLFSAFDAFEEWRNSEGEDLLKRIQSTSFAFLGDFIGAPLDLLKSGITYIYRNVMGLEVDENGRIQGDGVAAAIGRVMQDFSFENAIKALPETLLGIVQRANEMILDITSAIFPELVPSSYDAQIKSLRRTVRGYNTQAGGYADQLSAARGELGDITGDIATYQGQLSTMGSRKSEIEAEIARLMGLRETAGGRYRETRFGPTVNHRILQLGEELDALTGGMRPGTGEIAKIMGFLAEEQARLGPAQANVANLEMTVGRLSQQYGSAAALLVATEALKDAEVAARAGRGNAIVNNTDNSVTSTSTNVFAGQTTAATSDQFEVAGN